MRVIVSNFSFIFKTVAKNDTQHFNTEKMYKILFLFCNKLIITYEFLKNKYRNMIRITIQIFWKTKYPLLYRVQVLAELSFLQLCSWGIIFCPNQAISTVKLFCALMFVWLYFCCHFYINFNRQVISQVGPRNFSLSPMLKWRSSTQGFK